MKRILLSIVLLLAASFCTPLLYAAESSAGVGLFTSDTKEDEFLSPDVAFKLEILPKDANHLTASFKVESGYYLYKQRISFKDGAGKVLAAELPLGDVKDDPNFGKQEVYHHDFAAMIPIEPASNIQISARYQGCSEKGLCYAPQNKTFDIALNGASPAANTGAAAGGVASDDKATSLLKGGKLWLIIVGFFGFGLLLSLTPCVLPMIPILSGIIVGDRKAHHFATSRAHSFNLSLAYVLGMALSYTLAGIAAGLSGQLLSNTLQNPWVLGLTALIFVALAFSMFGFYELRLPHNIENKMINATNKLKGGQFLGVFGMGVVSALIVSPCVAAPLAGALIYISQTHDVVLGGIALFALSIGMGVPLLLLGLSAGHVLPKAGAWMNHVRHFFGVLMLLMAAYIVWPILPNAITQPVDKIMNKALGFEAASHLPFSRVKSIADLDVAIKNANGKTVMLDFYADWCTSCKEMEKLTFTDNKVKAALANTVLLQADVTENNADDQALLKRFNLFGPPGIIFFDKSGQEISTRVIGFKNAEEFTQVLNHINQN